MEIILYSRNDCPKCTVLKEKMKKKNINFSICEDEDILKENNIDLVPVLFVDGKRMEMKEANNFINNY